jgi:ABC-2 type transport system ATP-binding protein
MNQATPIIAVQDLTKAYKGNQVLKGVSFTVRKGSIFALLGSNGAGKTTTVKILATLLRPDGGWAEICGYDVEGEAGAVRGHISPTGQYAAVDETLTGRETPRRMGALRHEPDKHAQADRLLDSFRLTDAADRPVSTYSGGMRRRLDIAMSMVGNAPAVFLDEPTTGLDPQNRLAMWDTIKSMAAAGTTVLLTTQYLDEAEYLADHIAILHEGVIIADGTGEALKEKLPQGIVQPWFGQEADLGAAAKRLGGYAVRRGEGAHALDVQTDGGAGQFADVLNRLIEGNIEILKFAPKQPTLEDAFLTLIGERKEESGHAPE